MRNHLLLALNIAILLAAGQMSAYADMLILKDGRKIEDIIIVEEQKDAYVVKIKIGTAKIDKDMIQEIKKSSNEENHLTLGDQYFSSHNYEAALEQYKKALEINPGFQQAKDAIIKTEEIINEVKEKQRLELAREEEELPQKKEAVAKSLGLKIEAADSHLKVSDVVKEGMADTAGVKNNDLIIQINDLQAKDKSPDEALEYLTKGESGVFTFILQREVELTRKKFDYQKRPFVGVGIFLDSEGDNLAINSVIPGEPADLAGLKPKDKIISIDDKSTTGLSVDDAAALIGGPENSSVKLVIQRSVGLRSK